MLTAFSKIKKTLKFSSDLDVSILSLIPQSLFITLIFSLISSASATGGHLKLCLRLV